MSLFKRVEAVSFLTWFTTNLSLSEWYFSCPYPFTYLIRLLLKLTLVMAVPFCKISKKFFCQENKIESSSLTFMIWLILLQMSFQLVICSLNVHHIQIITSFNSPKHSTISFFSCITLFILFVLSEMLFPPCCSFSAYLSFQPSHQISTVMKNFFTPSNGSHLSFPCALIVILMNATYSFLVFKYLCMLSS